MLCAYDSFVNDMSFGRICCVELSVWIFYSMDLLWFEIIWDLPHYVLRMISEVELQALADLKSILYGLCSERFGIELCVELKIYVRGVPFILASMIMPPRMMTRSAGRVTAAPRGGRTGGRTSRGGGKTRGRSGDQGNGGIDGQGGQVGGLGNEVNDDDNA
ncbi:hypothetical protein Tco_0995640 [Tanacetum coccineum]